MIHKDIMYVHEDFGLKSGGFERDPQEEWLVAGPLQLKEK